MTTYSDRFTKREWKTLQMATFWVLAVVGLADGTLDKEETAAFQEYLEAGSSFPSGLSREVLLSVFTDLASTSTSMDKIKTPKTPEKALRKVGRIVDRRVPRDEAAMYKVMLLDLGSTVALSNRRVLRSETSRSERRAVDLAREWLGLSQTDAEKALARYEAWDTSQRSDLSGDPASRAPLSGPHATVPEKSPARHIYERIMAAGDPPPDQSDGDEASTEPTESVPDHRRRRAFGRRKSSQSRRSATRFRKAQETAQRPISSDAGRDIVHRAFSDMLIDDQWATRGERGFAWWPYRLKQRVIASTPMAGPAPDTTLVTARTDLVRNIEDYDRTCGVANAFNATAGMSAIVVDPVGGHSHLTASIVISPNALLLADMFTTAAAFQAARAHEIADEAADLLDGLPSVSTHHLSGQREIPDDMLSVTKNARSRGSDVPIHREDFEEAFDLVSRFRTGEAIALVSFGDTGMQAELPFFGSVPYDRLDRDAPDVRLGTAILTVDVYDGEAREIAPNVNHPLIQPSIDTANRLGCGLHVRLALPIETEQKRAISLAAKLNRLEASGKSLVHLIGAWYAEAGGLSFTGYYPNLLLVPITNEERIVFLDDIITSQIARCRWALDFLSEQVPSLRGRRLKD